jgi:nucleoside phosphorylase
MAPTNAKPGIDIGVLTIREDEFRAALAVFPDPADPSLIVGRRHYNIRLANAGGGAVYRVAIVRQLEQGNGEALDAARDLIEDLAPRLLLVVGIAGGVPRDDLALGDVVLATRVHDYSVEARKERECPSYALSGGPIDKTLATAIVNLPAREAELGPWTTGLPPMPSAGAGDDQLYGPDAWRARVRASLTEHFGAASRTPTYVSGVIATSDRLVKDPSILIPWLETSRHILAVEMESGGVYRAGRDRAAILAIRGISDIIGLQRDNRWTRYACASAAAFARAFLQTTPIPPEQRATPKAAGAPPLATPKPPSGCAVTSASLRRLLLEVLRGASDFDAFCLDYFRDAYRRFSDGMDRPHKVNILFEEAAPDDIVAALKRQDPGRFAAQEHLLDYE